MNIKSILLFGLMVLFISCKPDSKNMVEEENVEVKESGVSEPKPKVVMSPFYKQLTTDYCMGKFEPKDDPNFVQIPVKYADRAGLYLRKDVFDAYKKMYEAALKEEVNLQIRSATRNFNYQKGIWERKWNGTTKLSDGTNVATDIKSPKDKALKILEYSSMPGTSRHHWGTDIDLNAFSNSYFENGKGKKIYDWLSNNAADYGFCQPYSPKGPERPNGYNEEKWHWTYLPLGNEITNYAETNLKNNMIKGFLGAETASEIDVVNNYVLGINSSCRQ